MQAGRETSAEEKLRRRENEDALGRDIIDECRVQLMLKFRFLDRALWRMDAEPVRAGGRYPLATDAERVAYDPPRVIARFQESFEESVRDYLHLVLHCVFRHPLTECPDDRDAWSLACDIVVESAAMDLAGTRFESAEDPARRAALGEISLGAGGLAPGAVLGLVKGLMKTPDGEHFRSVSPSALAEWRALFERDDHGAWLAFAGKSDESSEDSYEEVSEGDEPAPPASLKPETGEPEPDEGALEEGSEETTGEKGAEEASDEAEDAGDESAADMPDEVEREQAEKSDEIERRRNEWDDISKEIEMNLETFSKEWGDEAGSFMATLAIANRPTYDYTRFLERFMTMSEELQISRDEYDYIYYSYGMELYGNMPLLEPLEYQETERVRSFAIVVDTSESVKGPLVRRFLAHTFSLLASARTFARDVDIHVIQCDARVQADTRITNLREVDALTESFVVRGFGGTDFRPAFAYVESLRARGELPDMKGLIYFTDGLGQFPEKPPDYDAAFVFVDDGITELPPVPPWAMRIVIDESSLERLGGEAHDSEEGSAQ